jgi:glyoxylase-like metal-dependent hydrolase (beta-lactamase superfamily II)
LFALVSNGDGCARSILTNMTEDDRDAAASVAEVMMRSLAGVALILFTITCGHIGSPATQAPAFVVKQLAPKVWAVIADIAGVSGNSGFVVGDDGVLVIDSLGNAEAARQLLADIHKFTTLPVKYVINTHHHFDHTAGNQVFVDAGAVVLAQRNVRTWILAEKLKEATRNDPPELKAIIKGVVPPTVLYDEGVDLYLGSRQVQVRSFPGHTGGDSVVVIPDAKVVFCGDLFWRNTLPNLVDATTKSWIETLDNLEHAQAKATFVPGHGDVGNVADVTAFRGYLETVRSRVADAKKQGKSGDAITAAVLPAINQKYRTWNYLDLAKSNIVDVNAELDGIKTIPQPEVQR